MAYRKKVPVRTNPSGQGENESIRTAAAKPSAMVLGDELEYRIARLQIFMGYFVRRGCPIYTVAALDRATDLDVLAIRYTEPFRRESMVTECKGGRTGEAGPLDRIFWLAGVKAYVGAHQALLVRKGTKWNIKEFAKQNGIQVLDLFRLTELEASYKVGETDWPGISDRGFYAQVIPEWNKDLAKDQRLWELFFTLTGEVRYDEPFVGINYLLQQLRLLTKSWTIYPVASFHRFILAETISQLSVFLMQVTEQCFDLGDADREGFIRKGLTYGSLEPRYAERILRSAYNLTRQAVQHYTNREIDIDRSLFEMPVPPATSEMVGIVADLLKTYPISLNVPQVCDLLLTEVFVKENKSKGWLRRVFPQADLAARVEIIRRLLKVLVSVGACPAYILETLNIPVSENGGATHGIGGAGVAVPVAVKQSSAAQSELAQGATSVGEKSITEPQSKLNLEAPDKHDS